MNENIDRIRHSAAHVLAMAAIRLFPETKIGIGPVTEEGYYYDFEFPHPITPEDLRHIEAEMNLIIQSGLPFQQIIVSKEEAFDILLKRGQIYKAELLREIPEIEISFFRTGDEFIDLCRGPHVNNTREIGIVKLVELSDAHWRNDPTRPQLQRIAGVAFPTLPELQDYLSKREAISNRDFRMLAKQIQLTLGGESEVVYTPGGTLTFRQIQKLIQDKYRTADFAEIMTSPVTDLQQSGDGLDKFYNHKNRSYKELPIKLFTSVRNELEQPVSISGRDCRSVSTITCKSFFNPSDSIAEMQANLQPTLEALETLQVGYTAQLFVSGLDHPLLEPLSEFLQRKRISQTQVVTPNVNGIEIHFVVQDSLDRNWVFNQTSIEESKLPFVSRVGEMTRTMSVISFFNIDGIIAYFLEDREGLLPMWLAPIQIVIIPIAEAQQDFGEQIEGLLIENGFRVQIDARSETMQSRIRQAELLKIPVIIVIGEKEKSNKSVSLRQRNQKEIGLVSEDVLVQTIVDLYK